MLDLTKQEKIILLFLTLTFATGLGINAYKKSKQKLELNVHPSQMAKREDVDKIIAQKRTININSAKVDELTRLPGIGEKLAVRIIEYQKTHGPFKSQEELMRVEGIGEKKFQRLKDLIVLE